MAIVYETDRLLLREFRETDAERLFLLDSDPEVRQFVGQPPPKSVAPYFEAVRGRYRAYYKQTPRWGYWALEERLSGTFIGWFHLRPAEDYRFAEACRYRIGDLDLGYRLMRSAWGQGYATEMSRHLVSRALAYLGAARVVACTLATNTRSYRELEKAGLARHATVQLPGFEPPAYVYAASRVCEW